MCQSMDSQKNGTQGCVSYMETKTIGATGVLLCRIQFGRRPALQFVKSSFFCGEDAYGCLKHGAKILREDLLLSRNF